MSVFGVKQRNELRVNGVNATESASQEFAYEFPIDRGVVSREVYVFQVSGLGFQIIPESFHLCGFSGPIQSFYYNQHIRVGIIPITNIIIFRRFA